MAAPAPSPSPETVYRTRLEFKTAREAQLFARRLAKMTKAPTRVMGDIVFTNASGEHLAHIANNKGPKPLFASAAGGPMILAAALVAGERGASSSRDAPVVYERSSQREAPVVYEGGADCEVTKLATIERDPELFGVSMDKMRKFGEIRTPADVYRVIGSYLQKQDQEVFVVLPLDVHYFIRCMPIEVARGAVDHVSVDSKTILRAGVLMNANYLVVAHNHPTGRPTASAEDRKLTKAIEAGCAQTGLKYLDHVVIGRKSYYSIREGKLYKG